MKVTLEDARLKIVAAIEALRPTAHIANVEVEYDGKTTVNVSTATKPYIKVWIDYIDGMQMGLGPSSGDRAMGTIILEARQRENTGKSDSNKLVSHFCGGLQRSDAMYPVRTHTGKFASPPNVAGWSRVGVAIPFWWDSTP